MSCCVYRHHGLVQSVDSTRARRCELHFINLTWTDTRMGQIYCLQLVKASIRKRRETTVNQLSISTEFVITYIGIYAKN